MQGDVSTKDLFTGSVILAVFLSLVFLAGKLLYKFKTSRFRQAWQPLVPLISGTIVDDGGGAATSWLTGTFQGRSVRASMVPGRNRYSGETGERYNYFEVSLLKVPGTVNWSIDSGSLRRQPGPPLPVSDIRALLAKLGAATLSFDARQQSLTLIQEPGVRWTPSPEHFQLQLATLLQIAVALDHHTP